MDTSSARRAVTRIANSTQVQEDAQFAVNAAEGDADSLKVAAFALFVAPITRGVEAFLENADSVFADDEVYSINGIGLRIGGYIYDVALGAIRETEGQNGPTAEVAQSRAHLTQNPNHAHMLAPIDRSLHSAAVSSVQSMINVALANAYTVRRQDGNAVSEIDLIARVRASTHLALSIPMVHLLDLPVISTILSAYNYSGIMGRQYPDPILKADPETMIVSTGKPLQEWNIGPALTIRETAGKNGDVRIGCPFSFADKSLRVAYYQAVVDVMSRRTPDVFPAACQ